MPAGGFDSAIAAIEGGADALYLGFSEFSARKQARNFDRLEYRRLHRFAREKGIRLYATLNTILLDGEIERASALLAFLGRFPPDAILVQDWGLAALIRERHPGIALHASTQAAIQGSAVGIAKELGVSRVVLPRETSLAEMTRLREEEPDLEYEAFVHGALCYSFSGLCLASGLVLGRSGNRGECAQLCRSYYDAEDLDTPGTGIRASHGGKGYWFSCRDLDLSDRVGELAAAGICSLKVEGRMKAPEYCYAVARLYRGIIDRLDGSGPDESEIDDRRRAARIAFSRSPTEGWLHERGGASLIDPEYPGHRGAVAGTIRSASDSRVVIDLVSDLGLRDGLLGFEEGDAFRPVGFSAIGLRDPRTGRELIRAKAGERIELDAPLVKERSLRLKTREQLFRISAREMDRRAPSPEEYEAEREEVQLRLKVEASRICAELELPGFSGMRSGRSGSGNFTPIEAGEALPFDRARTAGSFSRALSLFSESGEADFRLVPEIEPGLTVELQPGVESAGENCGLADAFLPPSILKREKKRIYARAAEIIAEAESAYARESAAMRKALPDETAAPRADGTRFEAPPRAELVFPRPGLPSGMPFATRRDLISGTALPSWGGRLWLPLSPLVADRGEYERLVRDRVRKELDSDNSVCVGLGALHHIALAREIRRELAGGDAAEAPASVNSLGFFLDINLYVANDLAFARLSSLLPRVEFAYRYIEAGDEAGSEGEDTSASRIVPVGSGFEAPLFQSLGCALKHHVHRGSCPPDCPRAWSTHLRDRDRLYRLVVEDCVTMLFRKGVATENPT